MQRLHDLARCGNRFGPGAAAKDVENNEGNASGYYILRLRG